MKVEKITIDNKNAFLLVEENGQPIIPVAKYMKYLHNKEKSSNTLHTYCSGLKHYFEFLKQVNKDYKEVNFELLSNFVSWLRNPHRNSKILTIDRKKKKLSESTVNLYITAITNFYDYLYRNEMIEANIVEKLMKQMFVGLGGRGYKDFLHHVNGDNTKNKNLLKLDEPKKKLTILSKDEVKKIYEAATNIRDKFLIWLLFETGLRIGECLSLFIEDIKPDSKTRKHKIQLTDRGELPNGGKLKTGERKIDITQNLVNLYDDYLYEIIDEFNPNHNFLFVKLWGENPGQPMTYSDVYATFKELERKTGTYITPHIFRHTHATIYYLQTKNIKMVQERLGHSQIQTTMNLYVHPSEDEIRKEWEKAATAFEFRNIL